MLLHLLFPTTWTRSTEAPFRSAAVTFVWCTRSWIVLSALVCSWGGITANPPFCALELHTSACVSLETKASQHCHPVSLSCGFEMQHSPKSRVCWLWSWKAQTTALSSIAQLPSVPWLAQSYVFSSAAALLGHWELNEEWVVNSSVWQNNGSFHFQPTLCPPISQSFAIAGESPLHRYVQWLWWQAGCWKPTAGLVLQRTSKGKDFAGQMKWRELLPTCFFVPAFPRAAPSYAELWMALANNKL